MPQKQKTADQIIADAKAAYTAAGGGKMSPAPATPPPAPAVKNEYSNAPYALAKAPQTGVKKEAADAGAGIQYRMKQAEALKQ